MKKIVGDATDMEHDTEEGPEADVTVIEEEGPGGDAIDTEEQQLPLTQKDQGVNNHIW